MLCCEALASAIGATELELATSPQQDPGWGWSSRSPLRKRAASLTSGYVWGYVGSRMRYFS